MKIWIKMVLAIILGALIGIIVPDFIFKNKFVNIVSDLAVNSLLYLTLVYVLVKSYLGFLGLIKNKISKRAVSLLLLFIVISVLFSILLSIGLMNINAFKIDTNFNQKTDRIIEPISIVNMLNNIINQNIISSFEGPVKYLIPIVFIAIIFAAASFFSDKKGLYFVDTVESFDVIFDKIVIQVLEYFAIGGIFVFASFVKSSTFSYDNLAFIFKPLIAIIIIMTILVIIYIFILSFFIKKRTGSFFVGYLGAGLMSFVTGNAASSIIILNEQIKNNIGVKKEISDSLTPIGFLLNKSGTVVVSTIVLMSIILIYTEDILDFKLQILFFILMFIYSLFLDGANEKGFLILVATILNINMLHLEQTGYLLFIASLPLFSRLAIVIDTLSTSVIITLVAKLTGNLEDKKYIEFI